MPIITLNLAETVKSESASGLESYLKSIDKKALFDLIDDGLPSDLTGPEDILAHRFISYKNGVARFGIVVKDDDEEVGFNISGLEVRVEPEFDDSASYAPTLAEAKRTLALLR